MHPDQSEHYETFIDELLKYDRKMLAAMNCLPGISQVSGPLIQRVFEKAKVRSTVCQKQQAASCFKRLWCSREICGHTSHCVVLRFTDNFKSQVERGLTCDSVPDFISKILQCNKRITVDEKYCTIKFRSKLAEAEKFKERIDAMLAS